MTTTRPHVQTLLAQYEHYKQLLQELAVVERSLAKAAILQQPVTELQEQQKQLQQKLQAISDAMTFADPLIWIEYKYRAYQNEAQPITTLQDLRVHCSKQHYICTKRYTFLNDELQKRGESALSDTNYYDGTLGLSELLASDTLQRLVQDSNFSQQWQAYEYFKKEGTVAKWENFNA